MKRFMIVILILSASLCFSSCTLIKRFFYPDYAPEGKEDLYTVAVSNIFGCDGYVSNGEVTYDPTVMVIETDSYGRTLFYYTEYYTTEFVTGYVIMQKSENGEAYYYQYDCYLPYSGALEHDDEKDPEKAKNIFNKEEVDSLKQRNDWDKELDLSKCTKTKIVLRRDSKKDGREFERILKSDLLDHAKELGFEGQDASFYSYEKFCCSDKNGLELYCLACTFYVKNDGSKTQMRRYAVIMNAGKKIRMIDVTGSNDGYDQIKQLMDDCGWEKPKRFDF